ncbi:two-component system response regulator YesN [Paenibacillus taihuensis]|uniref:Two-component system response regulator YesN n=1 Tax=Paenibacillus taihuensis TaxID=1156355 RepID=A0A3D9R0R0_9BACL|nr:helix-turn-helix domain-containing protein [Paenibacillus taihuensis]REE67650.1 two-component system response regulator YesN [Paenibacillus taihuensis]
MYEMLIVDDERYAAEGICNCHDWASLGIGHVHTAFSAEEARTLLTERAIAILICDIEMPDEDGLSLVRWVKDHCPHTESLFLTCHSEFDYAKQAFQLKSFDYLLKPVDSEELANVVAQMIKAIQGRAEKARSAELVQQYESLWSKQQPKLAERFWQDLLARRILTFDDFLERALKDARLALSPDAHVLPILIHVEEWLRPFAGRDLEMMRYAVQKAAEELLLAGAGQQGQVVTDRGGQLFVMVYEQRPFVHESAAVAEQWEATCRSFVTSCKELFYCRINCYVGYFAPLHDMPGLCDGLKELQHTHVGKTSPVLVYSAEMDAAHGEKEKNSFVQQTIQFIKDNVEEDISRDDVAAHVGLNPAYLSRLFKKETGVNLIDYLIETKMNRAKQLLDTTDMTVSMIAQQVGYSNFSHFTRMFRKRFEANPQEYRKQ